MSVPAVRGAGVVGRRGLREISNIPVPLAKKVAGLKISAPVRRPQDSRPKEVCRPQEDPRPQEKQTIEDIDKLHTGNVFLVSEYAKDVYSYLMKLETKFVIKKRPLTCSKITDEMRVILVDWLVDVHLEFNLLQETLHTGVAILDRYLQVDLELEKEVFQLAGICALTLASKYEEVYAPSLDDLIYVCKNSYNRKQILEMEKKILKALDYDLGRPVSIVFLRRYNMVAKADKLQHCYSKYFIDLVLLDYGFCHVRPSLVAAAAAFIAMCVIDKHYDPKLWTSTMVHYSTYSFPEVQRVSSQMALSIMRNFKTKYDSVQRKYANSALLTVSMKTHASIEILKAIARSSATLNVLK